MRACKSVKESDFVDSGILALKISLDCDEKVLVYWIDEDTKIYTICLPKTEETYFPCCSFRGDGVKPQKCRFVC